MMTASREQRLVVALVLLASLLGCAGDDGSAGEDGGADGDVTATNRPDGSVAGSGAQNGGEVTDAAAGNEAGGEDTADGGATAESEGGAGQEPGAAGTGGASEPVTSGSRFDGAGTTAGYPLDPGDGPETAGDCPQPGSAAGSDEVTVIDAADVCFYGENDSTTPAATAEYIVENVDGAEYVHLRVTFDPAFVDNTYGANAVGWSPKRGHNFDDLVKSDHVELMLSDGDGVLAMHFKVDYIEADSSKPCGYGTAGVTGGDGQMFVGDAADVLAVATSLDRNLNGCGYCETQDSPATDEGYTPNDATPEWDYRMVYGVWIDADAFGASGFGSVDIEYVHASPAKGSGDTVIVDPGPCPPEWDEPYCPPHLIEEGGNCGTTPDGGVSTDGGTTPDGGVPEEECDDGSIEYLTSEGSICAPEGEGGGCAEGYVEYVTFDGAVCAPVPGEGGVCPQGFTLDPVSEGEICIPEK